MPDRAMVQISQDWGNHGVDFAPTAQYTADEKGAAEKA
jgi:hypothetical protein